MTDEQIDCRLPPAVIVRREERKGEQNRVEGEQKRAECGGGEGSLHTRG